MADTPKVVSTAAPRYIHGIQSNVNASDAWLTPRIQENEQATLMDFYTDYGTTTVEGDLYVMSSSDGTDHRIQDAYDLSIENQVTTKKYHGIFYDALTNSYETTISYNVSTRTFTISPTAGSFRFWIDGELYVKNGPQSISHAATEGGWFFYFNSSGVLTASQTVWSLLNDVPLAFLYYDASTPEGLLLEERHHHESDKEWHNSQHFAMGTFVKRGTDFTIGGYTIGVSSNAAVTWDLGAGTVVDEDINTAVSAVVDGGPYQTWYKLGASGAWRRIQRTLPFHFNAGTNWMQYNQLTGGAWQLTDMANNQFVNYYIFAVPATDTTKQIIVIPSQQVYASEIAAESEGLIDLDLTGFPSQEFVGVWKLTYRTDTGGAATGRGQIRVVQKLIGARTASFAGGASPTVHNALSGRADPDSHPATAIQNTPSGNITATTVQAAINELDSEKAQLSGALTNTRVVFVNASGFLSDNANFYYSAGTGLRITDATASTSTTSGAFVVAGGIGVGGAYNGSGDITTSGDVYVNGGDIYFTNPGSFFFRNSSGVYRQVLQFFTDNNTYWTNQDGSHVFRTGASASVRMTIAMGGDISISNTTASTSVSTGALTVSGGIGCGDYFTGRYRSSDGTAGLTATRTFYAASSSGGAVNVLNTVTIKDGIITSWTQA